MANGFTNIFHRNGNIRPVEYSRLSCQIQLIKTIIKERVELYQMEEFNKRLEGIKPGPTAFREIFKITGYKKSKFFNKVIVDDNIFTEDCEKVDALFKLL